MSDAELLAEVKEHRRREDWEAARDPARLLRHLNPRNYRRRAHLNIISNALRDVRMEYDAGESVSGPRLLIEEPPQTGKTVTAVVGGAFWWLVHHPKARIVIGSYGDSLAVDRGRDVKKLVEEYGHRYGLKLAHGSESVQDWRLTTGGGVRSVGVGTGIAGYPGDIAFIDDPLKSRQEADSLRARERVMKWFSADITSRLSPGAPIILIMTPWHEDDIAARVIVDQGRADEGGRWRVIRMPALCDDPKRDPLHRKEGDPLPHPRIKPGDRMRLLAHWQEKRNTSTLQDWFSLYQCDPKPTEGALLDRALLRERRCYSTGSACHPCDPKPTKAAVAVDPSGGGRDTAGIVGGYLGSDKRLYITHDRTGIMPSDQWARKACELAIEIDADRVVVENNFGGDMAKLTIRTAWDALIRTAVQVYEETREEINSDPTLTLTERTIALSIIKEELKPYQRLCPRIVTVRAKKNKKLRAEPIAQQWTEDRVRTAAYLPELENEWCVAGGELVTTQSGLVPIERVRVGDQVATRNGWRPVVWSGQTGVRETLTITTSDGRTLRCTGNHEVWVDGKGWTRADEVEKSDRMLTWCERKPETMSTSMENGITEQRTDITKEVPPKTNESNSGYSTALSGQPTTDQYQHVTSSDTAMVTSPTTTSATSRQFPTDQHADGPSSMVNASTVDLTATTSVQNQSTENDCSTEPCGLPTTGQSPTRPISTTKTRTAPTTASTISGPSQRTSTYTYTNQPRLEQQPKTEKQDQQGVETSGADANPERSPVLSAEPHTCQQGSGQSSAHQCVGTRLATVASVSKGNPVEPVYDLSVFGDHEFFANGLLVHNCTWQADLHESPGRIDASVYLAYALLPVPGSGSGSTHQQPRGTLPTTGMSPLGGSSGGVSGLGPLG